MNIHENDDLDRRPIQSRETRWAESITMWLVRRRFSPNAISIVGMIAAIGAGVCLWCTDMTTGIAHHTLWLSAAILCQARLLCNLFDGMVAVKRGIASRVGELYNEVPDRVSDAAILIGLGYSFTGQAELGFLAAILAVFVAYVRVMAKSVGAPSNFCGPMAKPQRMAIITVLAIYMGSTPTSWRIQFGESSIILLVIIAACLLTAWRRLRFAVVFLKSNDA